MAAEDIFGLKVQKLTFHYLEGNKKVSFLASKEEIEKEKENIVSQIKTIEKRDFKPNPGWHCKSCDFKNICSYAKR